MCVWNVKVIFFAFSFLNSCISHKTQSQNQHVLKWESHSHFLVGVWNWISCAWHLKDGSLGWTFEEPIVFMQRVCRYDAHAALFQDIWKACGGFIPIKVRLPLDYASVVSSRPSQCFFYGFHSVLISRGSSSSVSAQTDSEHLQHFPHFSRFIWEEFPFSAFLDRSLMAILELFSSLSHPHAITPRRCCNSPSMTHASLLVCWSVCCPWITKGPDCQGGAQASWLEGGRLQQ